MTAKFIIVGGNRVSNRMGTGFIGPPVIIGMTLEHSERDPSLCTQLK